MRRVPQSYPNTRVRRTADPRATRRQKLLLVSCIALACGFVEEGRLRKHVYLRGHYVDRVIMGILREEYTSTDAP